jgi:hypothetical protein
LAIMIVNVTISFGVVVVYSYWIAPGHDEAFYAAAARRIAPWSSVVFGAPLFFVASRWLARKRPDRNPVAFALWCFAFYASVDVAVLIASGEVTSQIGIVSLSLATKLAGALLGARRAPVRQGATPL